MSIEVTKPFLPPLDEFNKYVEGIFQRDFLTNEGPLVKELERQLSGYFAYHASSCDDSKKPFVSYVTNGTIALQLAIKALGIKEGSEIITTPFTYVATLNSVIWEHCVPVFADIEEDFLTMDPKEAEKKITDRTAALMPVHVFGNACDVDRLGEIASGNRLKLIYDAAHTFGSFYKGRPLVSYGDISTISFHATKLFHTIEGGACITSSADVFNKIDLLKRFGHNKDTYTYAGINGKQDEFNAAMGLCNLKYAEKILASCRSQSEKYDSLLGSSFARPAVRNSGESNRSYYPVIFKSESALLEAMQKLAENDIHARRYFYPSLNTLPFLKEKSACPISEDISRRILCLPLYYDLTEKEIERICTILME